MSHGDSDVISGRNSPLLNIILHRVRYRVETKHRVGRIHTYALSVYFARISPNVPFHFRNESAFSVRLNDGQATGVLLRQDLVCIRSASVVPRLAYQRFLLFSNNLLAITLEYLSGRSFCNCMERTIIQDPDAFVWLAATTRVDSAHASMRTLHHCA